MPKPKNKGSKPGKVEASEPPPAPPSWPAFKPPLPIVDLSPVPHPLTSNVVLIPSFFPRSLCRDYVSFLKTLPLQTTPGRPKRGDAVRVNDRFQVDSQDFATRLWEQTGLKEVLLDSDHEQWGGEPVGLSYNIRIYRYSKGQFFDCHYDDSNNLTLPLDPPVPVKTTWTLLLYLTSSSEGCVGGETVFYPRDRRSAREEIVVPLETGMLLLHKHGDDCLLHEGREVTEGEKWVLRTDLCIRR
ncbi:hypothetical protein BKA59DRAFT_486212 [Fusarium tricinctum]|uniref:Fe2OG dioxygenase domain-containing protein n=1 Tax=Fusarium tricinctum TaxID=61284 RepID=A0A8K0RNT4_9HYPO|nr:hypothetical protein BKA59DRAFT_486212 [Fusarium tricinctum]